MLGLCGIAGVVVIDEQAIYDSSDPDDKLLLDLKGTMSEADLHWLGLRLMAARRQKARRGAASSRSIPPQQATCGTFTRVAVDARHGDVGLLTKPR